MMRISRTSRTKCVVPEGCREDVRECDKHEIIIKISEMLGSCPTKICVAEMIFEHIKYDVARYILNHECCRGKVREETLIWLEEKSSPEALERLTRFIDIYLKK